MNQIFSKLWIIVISVVFVAGGIFAWQYFGAPKEEAKTPEVKTPEELTKDKTAGWNNYSNPEVNFVFKYPKNWEVIDDYFYETLGGIKSTRRTVNLKKIDEDEWISINQRQFQCGWGKCAEIDGNTIGTYSKNSEILDIFEKIIISFKVDETADWKTYRNEQYGFEIKYPTDWEIGQPPIGSIVMGPKSMVEEMNKIGWATEGGYIPVSINKYTIKPDIKSDEVFKITGERLITINNLSAAEYDILVLQDFPGLQKDQKIVTIVVQNAADFYKIDLVKNQYLAIFNQMLSTFKFFEVVKPTEDVSKEEKYCKTDTDCACGVNINTRGCFYGNKDYVDTKQQCPDFCAGISGDFIIRCVNNECKQLRLSQ